MEFLSLMKFINFLNKYKFFILFLVVGLIIFYFPCIKSSFDLMQGEFDNKYFNFVLEYGYKSFCSLFNGNYFSFWQGDKYFLNPNSLAQNDTLISILPLYIPIRTIIKNPFTSFQVLYFILSLLNYFIFYYFLSKTKLKFSDLSSSIGAFLFAFGILRTEKIDEINYYTQFFSILCLIFILKADLKNKPIVNNLCFLFAGLTLALQFYGCCALGLFTLYFGIFLIVLSLFPYKSREILIKYFKDFKKYIILYFFVFLILLIPMVYHFSLNNKIIELNEILNYIPINFAFLKNNSVLNSIFFHNTKFISDISYLEINSGYGILTLIFSFIGMILFGYYKTLPIISIWVIYLISFGYSAILFWTFGYIFLFGTESILVVNRLVFVGLIIIAISCSNLINYLQNKNKRSFSFLLVLVILLLVLEQIPFNNDINSLFKAYGWKKSEFISQLNNIKFNKNNSLYYFEYLPINHKKINKNNKKVRDYKKKKEENLVGLWLSLKFNKKTANEYYKNIYKNNNNDFENKCYDYLDYSKI